MAHDLYRTKNPSNCLTNSRMNKSYQQPNLGIKGKNKLSTQYSSASFSGFNNNVKCNSIVATRSSMI